MKFNTRNVLVGLSILVVGTILYYFRAIVSYVALAWVISMIGAPLVKFLRKYLGKNLSAGITLGAFFVLFVLLLYIFVPPLVTQVKNLSSIDYDKALKSIEQPIGDWEQWLIKKNLITAPDTLSDESLVSNQSDNYIYDQRLVIDSLTNPYDSSTMKNINLFVKIDASDLIKERNTAQQEDKNVDFFEKMKTSITYYINPKRIQELFTSTVSAFGNVIIGIASVFFIAFFFLKEQGLFYNMIRAAVPQKHEGNTTKAIDQTSSLLIRYFSGILVQMIVITLFVSLALTILGVKNALLIGFFAAIMNVIPYIGPIIGAAFAVIITISSNLDVDFYEIIVPQLSKVVIVFALMQALDNFILQPTIFSRSVKAHPLEIFLIVLVGAQLGGVIGMVLAIPAYTVFRVIGKVFLSEFKVIQQLTKNI